MKHQIYLLILLILLIIIVLISTTDIIIKVLMGYTGFKQINSHKDKIYIDSECQNPYFFNKYNQFNINIKISFITSLVVSLTAAIGLIITIIYQVMLKNLKNRHDISDNRFIGNRYNENILNYFIDRPKLITIYIILFFGIISSYVSFHQFLQILPENNYQSCSIIYQSKEKILMFTIFSGINLLLFVIAMMLLISLTCEFNVWEEQVQAETKTINYHQEVHRIIEQIPESQRKIFKDKQSIKPNYFIPKESQVQPYEFKEYKSFYRSQQNDDIRIQNLHKVQSVLYKPDYPQLKLQSKIQ